MSIFLNEVWTLRLREELTSSAQNPRARSEDDPLLSGDGGDSYDLWLDHHLITESTQGSLIPSPTASSLEDESRCSNFRVLLNILDGVFWNICDAHYEAIASKIR